mgnify:CR=1 FL=1
MVSGKTARITIAGLLLTMLAAAGVLLGPARGYGQEQAGAAAAEPNDPNAAAAAKVAEPNAATPASLVPADAAKAADVTVETLEARKKQVVDSADLSEEIKAKLTEAYDKTIAQLKLADELKARRKQYGEALKGAPARLEEIKKSLAQPAAEAVAETPPDLTLAQAEQKLSQAKLALEEAKTTAQNLENEPRRRAERRTKIPEESSAAKQRLEEIKTLLAEATDPASALSQANRTLLQSEQSVLQERIEANHEEVLLYDGTSDLLAAERDLAARRVSTAEKNVEFWQKKVSDLRQEAAEAARQEADRAKAETRYAHPVIQEAARYNAELAQKQAELVVEIEKTSQYTSRLDEQLAELKKDLDEIQQQVEKAGGVTDVLGVRLLGKRSKLPSTSDNRRRIRTRPGAISQAQFNWIEYDNLWSQLSDVETRAETILAEAETPPAETERADVRSALIEHLQARRKTLKALSDLSLDYSTRLANLDAKERDYVATTQELQNFIDANILWVKSNAVKLSDANRTAAALRWLLSPANWRAVAAALWADFKGNPLLHVLIVLAAVSAVVFHARLHERLNAIGESVRQVQTDSFLLTLQAIALTLLLAAAWPVVLLLIGWRLSATAAADFVLATASGLFVVAPILFVFSFLGHLTMPHGLAQDHFRVREERLVFLRRHLRWLAVLVVCLALVLEIIRVQQTDDRWYGTAGRLFAIASLLGTGAFLLVVLRPSSPLMEPYLRQKRGGWLEKLRYIWYPLCLLLPVGFSALAGTGYFYAARHLTEKLTYALLLILFVILLKATFARWLMVAQRRLALLEREKRRAAEAQEAAQAQGSAPAAAPSETAETGAKPEQTIFQMSQQTRHLINAVAAVLLVVGLWYLWKDVLPAFTKLGEHTLWNMAEDKPITLGAVATALVAVVLTVVAARNAPGLLEIVILRRLPIDRGARFAIITISRYLLVIIGLIVAFTEIGIGWSKVQWLIAAMTVGLGFGLQEIFANFISGLIILFEQPIRVDDVVTVGDVTGKVSMIRIRATTIRKWDQRELIVPNKEFITGRLINWTLSDNVLRMVFPVGIAYGSDIRKAEKLLYEIAEAEPRVIDEPKPVVVFTGFGASSLDFELRVYLSGMDNYVPLWHSVNCAIDDAFRKAEIEIAFPQQDLHLRSIDPGLQNLFPPGKQ